MPLKEAAIQQVFGICQLTSVLLNRSNSLPTKKDQKYLVLCLMPLQVRAPTGLIAIGYCTPVSQD